MQYSIYLPVGLTLITYLIVSRNAGFKYLVCCSLPMVEATYMYQIFTLFIPITYLPGSVYSRAVGGELSPLKISDSPPKIVSDYYTILIG